MSQQSLTAFLGAEHTQFAIPLFQRPYSWTRLPCEEFWHDIMRAAATDQPHFMGTLLYLRASQQTPGCQRLAIIDGQQRLTTASLIIAALAAHLRTSSDEDSSAIATNLTRRFLEDDAGNPKLVPTLNDRKAYQALILGSALPEDSAPRFQENSALFRAKMDEDGFDTAQLIAGLKHAYLLAVEIEDRSQAQSVFESLNSKGMPLTTADLVRNCLLITKSRDEQTRLYHEYWVPIQQMFGADPGSVRLDNAILGWLSVRFPKVRAQSSKAAYGIFKRYLEESYRGTTEDLLDELRGFCLVWAENYRYHAVKKFRSANWAKNGPKTLVSDRPLRKPDTDACDTSFRNVDARW
ncbi:MAG: DUF262 domain-containing protein [Eggerthellaceae bacterium]